VTDVNKTEADSGGTQQKTEAPVAEKPATATTATTEPAPAKRRRSGEKVVAGVNVVRSRIASLVWLVAVVCALFLAVGALLVALKMNQANPIVSFVLDTAHKLDFGTFKDFTGKGAATKEALTNWGIAAVIYLVAGKVLDRIIRP
jgi:uncharacterized membrane protein